MIRERFRKFDLDIASLEMENTTSRKQTTTKKATSDDVTAVMMHTITDNLLGRKDDREWERQEEMAMEEERELERVRVLRNEIASEMK